MATIDYIILVIIAVSLLLGLHRGLVMTIAHCISGVVSFFAASAAASRLSESVARTLIAPQLGRSIAQSLEESSGGSVIQAWENQSEYLRGLLIKDGMSEETLSVSDNPMERLAEAIADTVGQAIAYVIIFILVFLLCTVLLRIVMNALNLVAHLPIIGAFNSLMGGLVGAAFGLLLCTCVLWALKLFVPAVYSDYGVLPPSMMRESKIAGTLVGWNEGISIFEMIPADT